MFEKFRDIRHCGLAEIITYYHSAISSLILSPFIPLGTYCHEIFRLIDVAYTVLGRVKEIWLRKGARST